jgi:hypothetical protein
MVYDRNVNRIVDWRKGAIFLDKSSVSDFVNSVREIFVYILNVNYLFSLCSEVSFKLNKYKSIFSWSLKHTLINNIQKNLV